MRNQRLRDYMLIEPSIIDVDLNGKPIYLGSPSNIKSKIDSQTYNTKICKRLNASPRKQNLKFRITQPRSSNTPKINFEAKDINKSIKRFLLYSMKYHLGICYWIYVFHFYRILYIIPSENEDYHKNFCSSQPNTFCQGRN